MKPFRPLLSVLMLALFALAVPSASAESMKRYGVPAEETEAALINIMSPAEPEPDPIVADAPIGRRKKL